MVPRQPPPPAVNIELAFEEMSHPELSRVVHWTCRLGPEANRLWVDDVRRRNKHGSPVYWHTCRALVSFLQSTYRGGSWPGFQRRPTGEATLRGIEFSGHQFELAELVSHILHAAGPTHSEADTLWDDLLAYEAVDQLGRDPYRREAQLLDFFLSSLPESRQEHIGS